MAVVISILWHLFWMSAIGIVVTPTVQSSNAYKEVDFLGPILEKTAFDLITEDVTPHAETLYAKSTLLIENIYLKPRGPEREILRKVVLDTSQEKFFFILRDYIKNPKEIPYDLTEDMRIGYVEKRTKKASSFIDGPLSTREIMFRPETFTVPGGLYGDQEEYLVRLKFFVTNNGTVRGIEPLVSSGYPEVDLLAVKSLKRWRFSPIHSTKRDNSSWGVVVIRIITK